MALPPSIPTSFVPRPETVRPRATHLDLSGAFYFLTIFLFVLALIGAGAAFFYDRHLSQVLSEKEAELSQKESGIDPVTASVFVHLRDRLAEGSALLDSHTTLSSVLKVFEALSPIPMRLKGLSISVADDGKSTLTADGSAASFNALAAASTALKGDKRIADPHFSTIAVNKDGSVTFQLSGALSSTLLTLPAATTTVALPVSTGAAATSTQVATSTAP